ncbi:MAG: XRE family transcriptional regulator [Nitrospira sp. LK70]|nr:helix-turn-helix transcriptional regulator [Nitrospira sp.]NGZ09666.1 XRE family transcriptional regulator [Nitrospira sp. LK70]
MSIGQFIQGWRVSRNQSIQSLSDAAGISHIFLEQIEADQADPTTGTIEALASVLRIPPSWLFDSPRSFECLFAESDGMEEPQASQIDPVTERILAGSRTDRSLYVLLTTLMQAGDPRFLRAAEMSLRSLVKQSRETPVPWQQRPSGHFEPPSD